MPEPKMWDLADLAGVRDLAEALNVAPSTIKAWEARYPAFPAPLVQLSSGPVYSMRQVRAWHEARVTYEWQKQQGRH